MSQQQFFNSDSLPAVPNIEFVEGTDSVPVGPNPTTHIIGFTSTGPMMITNTAPYTENFKLTFSSLDKTVNITQGGGNVDLSIATGGDGVGTTVGATTANLVTIALPVPAGTWNISATVTGYEPTGPNAIGFSLFGTFITNGSGVATLIDTSEQFNQSAPLAAAEAYFLASGNNAILQVLGVALLTISWICQSELNA
jgi:hypothetical protein